MSQTEYLRARLQLYDEILASWHEVPGLEQDYAELERHRNNVRDWFLTAAMKRGPSKRTRTEKEQKAFGGLFRKRA